MMITGIPLDMEISGYPSCVYCIFVSKLSIYFVISGVWQYQKKGVCSSFSSYFKLTIFNMP